MTRRDSPTQMALVVLHHPLVMCTTLLFVGVVHDGKEIEQLKVTKS